MPDLEGLARRGDAQARYEVAAAQLSGLGAKYDPERARGWLEKAAAQGHEKAAETLAIMRHDRCNERAAQTRDGTLAGAD